ncbi:hypothetical protein NC651_037990 [Populus alba x Populus x berolinensis]|nr:hypothetical protein NC651_037990 [Populus alba x Populus x berolinensis]
MLSIAAMVGRSARAFQVSLFCPSATLLSSNGCRGQQSRSAAWISWFSLLQRWLRGWFVGRWIPICWEKKAKQIGGREVELRTEGRRKQSRSGEESRADRWSPI